MVSYFFLMVMLLSVHAVVKWGIASLCPVFFVQTLSRTVMACCTCPPCWKCPKHWRLPNIGARLKFTDFLPNYSSLYLCSQASYQKTGKKILTITVQCQFLYSWPPIRGCLRDPPLWPQTVEMGCGWWGGGDRWDPSCTSFHLSGK
jgi:hypothetical protein